MCGLAAAERDLGHETRGARQQPAHRRVFGCKLPVAIERTPGLLDHADALGHGHERGRRRDDSRGRERQRVGAEIRGGKRQETAQAVVEDERGALSLHLDAAAPAVDLASQVPGVRELDQAALLHAAPQRQQRRVEARSAGKRQGDPAPGFRRVDEPRGVGGLSLPPAAWPAVAQHLDLAAGNGDLSERPDGVGCIQEGRFMARQLGRQAQLGLEAVAQASRDQHALGHQPGSAVENGGRAACPHVELGRVDHEHRGPAAAQELAPGEMDRLAGTAAFGEGRFLHVLQPLQRCQGLGTVEARQRAGEGRRRRHGARQRGSACVEPRRQRPELAHGFFSGASGGSARSWRA